MAVRGWIQRGGKALRGDRRAAIVGGDWWATIIKEVERERRDGI
ncbi:hypothetical protein CCACVL1_28766 [Corchorus capsularis]|uniref:Uncharacterized protein n=1 Tax=Corchorus capsularis TaxID=210143 RepID=A0A1R3G5D5_COCAP|nr:hypothetical protein CCACVL1_28766 [Corchorus capsularis]